MNQYPKLFREEIWEALYRDKATSAFKILLLSFLFGVILYEGGWQYFLHAVGMLFCLCVNFILLSDGYIFLKRMRSPSIVDVMILSVIVVVNVLVFMSLRPLWLLYIFIWVFPWIPYAIIRYFFRVKSN